MLFDYVAPASKPGFSGTVWSQFPLQPLTPGVLTPFSYSVLAELASRAWFVYFDRLGFEPTPRSRLVRLYKGRVYFNLSLSSQMEADHAGLEPLALHLNQQRLPLAKWEKPGFLAGFKLGRGQKKIDDVVADQTRHIEAVSEKARTWYLKTQSIQRWGQAEVLQIMEEIERVGVESMVAFFAARHNLAYHYGRLVADLAGKVNAGQALLLINNALGDVPGLIETTIADALPALAEAMAEPATLAWLKAGNFADWRKTLPSAVAIERVSAFLAAYGHRAVHEGEIANPRWSQDVSLLLGALLAILEIPAAPAKASPKANVQALLDALPSAARKQGEQSLHKIGELHKLQSRALHALAYIGGGTRSWALAAAGEAMVDKRLHSADEVFLFELEEIKEMMTGEWNISSMDEIRETVAKRQVEHNAIQQEIAPDILLGDEEAFVNHRGLPGVAGKATGPLCLLDGTPKQDCRGAIVATELLDSGNALLYPVAAGFVAATGTPCDPCVVAARAWQHPVAIGMGKGFAELADGKATTVNVNVDEVAVSQS